MRFYAAVLVGVWACGGGSTTRIDAGDVDVDAAIDSPPASRCGDGVRDEARGEDCDDGNLVANDGCDPPDCTFSTQCTDSNVCDGVATCNRTTHVCQPGTAPACADSSACTTDSCDGALGCRNVLVDGDGDGHAPMSAGACGDDCDDTRADIFTGAEELCDGADNNCNQSTDEVAPTWYVDCDGDGFAVNTAGGVTSCARPTASTGCGVITEQWVSLRPVDAGSTDCDDQDAMAHPRAAELCDRIDTDCSSGGATDLMEDGDGDGFAPPTAACSGGPLPKSDCDDTDGAVHP